MSDTNELDLGLLTDKQTARVLKVKPASLQFWRTHGGGPPWVRIGKRLVRYDPAALRKWITEQARG